MCHPCIHIRFSVVLYCYLFLEYPKCPYDLSCGVLKYQNQSPESPLPTELFELDEKYIFVEPIPDVRVHLMNIILLQQAFFQKKTFYSGASISNCHLQTVYNYSPIHHIARNRNTIFFAIYRFPHSPLKYACTTIFLTAKGMMLICIWNKVRRLKRKINQM